MKKLFVIIVAGIYLSGIFPQFTSAQCSVCKQSAENSLKDGSTAAKGLNLGILYLLVVPYALVGGIGYWWYTQKKKDQGSGA